MLSIVAPLYNQVEFIKAWCEFTTSISDDVIAIDTGCTDGTFDIIRDYPIKILTHKVSRKYEWPEGIIRNKLIDAAKNDWIFWLDGDELLGDDFRKTLPELVNVDKDVIWFRHYSFWLSPNLLRYRQLNNYHSYRYFYPSKMWKMFRNKPYIRYKESGNHAPLTLHGLGKGSIYLSSHFSDVRYFHYHHCIGRSGRHNGAADYDRSVKTMTYWGDHPKEVKHYSWWDDSLLFPAKGRVWDTEYGYIRRTLFAG